MKHLLCCSVTRLMRHFTTASQRHGRWSHSRGHRLSQLGPPASPDIWELCSVFFSSAGALLPARPAAALIGTGWAGVGAPPEKVF